jgi:hypothetical protein
MKKHPARHPARRVKTKVKRTVKRAVSRSAKLTQQKAAQALAQLKQAIAALKSEGPGARVKHALGLATKLNHLVKGMKSAGLI